MTFAPIKGQCPVCRQDAGLNLDPVVSFSESKQLAELRAENDSLKEVISLSEDSRLMDEYLKLERANARQAERIKEQAAEIERQRKVIEDVKTTLERVQDRGFEHGDNCYVNPDHIYGNSCVCGIESLENAIERNLAAIAELEKGVG